MHELEAAKAQEASTVNKPRPSNPNKSQTVLNFRLPQDGKSARINDGVWPSVKYSYECVGRNWFWVLGWTYRVLVRAVRGILQGRGRVSETFANLWIPLQVYCFHDRL